MSHEDDIDEGYWNSLLGDDAKGKVIGFKTGKKKGRKGEALGLYDGTKYGAASLLPTVPRTSTTHPIEIGRQRFQHVKGTLGGTLCPGKHQSFSRTGAWERNLDADLLRLRMDYHADVLVCLMEAQELIDCKVPLLLQKAESYYIRPLWYPIPDTNIPTDLQSFCRLITRLVGALKRGRNVVVHCKGGIGRTGTVNAAVMVAMGYTPDQAIKMARDIRTNALENKRQEDFIRDVFPLLWKFYKRTQRLSRSERKSLRNPDAREP